MSSKKTRVDAIVEDIIKASLIKPSPRFGDAFKVPCDEKIGMLVCSIRKELNVRAVEIATRLRISKCKIHFLESGQRSWSIGILKSYIAAAFSIAREKRMAKKDDKQKVALRG